MNTMKYYHTDVFAQKPLSGNGLTVVFIEENLSDSVLLNIAREFKQFETAFVYPRANDVFPVRVFTVQEELPFAGHPLIGAAAVIHSVQFSSAKEAHIALKTGGVVHHLTSTACQTDGARSFSVAMNQGSARIVNENPVQDKAELARFLGITESNLDNRFPLQVVSTGLPYLLVPLQSGLEKARIAQADFESYLAQMGAKFAYLFTTDTTECRTWDNTGLYEDIATGSAAGPLCAYLVHNGFRSRTERILIQQGMYLERPSTIIGYVDEHGDVIIEGGVSFFGEGTITL